MRYYVDGYDVLPDELLTDEVVAAMTLMCGEDEDDEVALPDPAESASTWDGLLQIRRWTLPDGRHLSISVAEGAITSAQVYGAAVSIADELLGDWDHDDCPEDAEWMEAWGLGGLKYLTVAEEGYEGPCRVWRETHYLPGTCGAPCSEFAREEWSEDIIEFATRAEAEDYVDSNRDDNRDGNLYRLSYGQYAADDLHIVRTR